MPAVDADADCMGVLEAAARGEITDTGRIADALEQDANAAASAASEAVLEALASGDDSVVRYEALRHPNLSAASIEAIAGYDGYDEFVRAEASCRLAEGVD